MEKQIEEMAIIIAKQNCKPCGCENCDFAYEYGTKEESCEDYLSYRKMAQAFYNAGYRMQEVVGSFYATPMKMMWHKVSDELPKTSGSYIVCTNKGNVYIAHYYADCGKFNAPFGWVVEYWMSLPSAPKGGEQK